MLEKPHSGTCRDATCHFKHHVRDDDALYAYSGMIDAQNDALVVASGKAEVRAHDRVKVIAYGKVKVLLWDEATCEDIEGVAIIHKFEPIKF